MAAARTLTAAEIQVVQHYISKHAYSKRNSMMFALSAFAGMRVGEIAGLVLGDVRGRDGLIQAEIQLAAHRVKHGTARTVYLNTRLQQQMADYVASRRWVSDTQPLFPTHRGPMSAFSPNTLAQHFYWLYRRCNLRASSHSGRKTFITNLSNQGISVFVLASLAGHKSITTTQRYVVVNDDIKRRAVELV